MVRWTWATKLKMKRERIKEGWGKCRMSNMLDAAFQRDALKSAVDNSVVQEGVKEEYQVEVHSDDDEEEQEDGVEPEGPAAIEPTD